MHDLSQLKVSSSPHIRNEDNVRQIMLDVIIALMPTLAISVYVFGARTLVLTLISVLGCMIFEAGYQLVMKKPVTATDLSAAVTGILLAFSLPVSVPIWMVLIGDAFAIVIVKQLYGGIGKNFLNPALTARCFLLACWPVALTIWPAIRTSLPLFATPDVISSATTLSYLKEANLAAMPSVLDMALGMMGGSFGETSTLALVAGGLYLLYRRVISLRIPLSFIGVTALLTLLFPRGGADPVQFMTGHLLSGGLFLAAFFMATDYTTSPVTKWGQVIFGAGCGALTVFIRYFGSYVEGVSYAVLIMNACVFLIEKVTHPKKYGRAQPAGTAKSGGKG